MMLRSLDPMAGYGKVEECGPTRSLTITTVVGETIQAIQIHVVVQDMATIPRGVVVILAAATGAAAIHVHRGILPLDLDHVVHLAAVIPGVDSPEEEAAVAVAVATRADATNHKSILL